MSNEIRVLKDGYWDRTSVVRAADGSLRVRKESKDAATPGPWAREALRAEIAYLSRVPDALQTHFPPLLDWWDGDRPGYEIPFYDDRIDLASLLLEGNLDPRFASALQRTLAEVIFHGVHRLPPAHSDPFSAHLVEIITGALEFLAQDARFRPLVHPATERIPVVCNGRRSEVRGLADSWRLLVAGRAPEAYDEAPRVTLHGDLIHENILVHPGGFHHPLILIDPVSVAGLTAGPPLFDLVKYNSFASGGLFAVRERLVTAGPSGAGYELTRHHHDPRLQQFRKHDFRSVFEEEFRRTYDGRTLGSASLLKAYFSLVMARNTSGTEQWARVIAATSELDRAAEELQPERPPPS